ncbi:MAG: 16S rRNA (uracil(1498)-N(3))-methyltransferase (EC 2.1.1.193) [Olavius algarvensis Delta 4 endosymbiont]|nr:MAG: 16S rRNA (uracil(1498)-N(3))-methyltransferase (EC 2.1.1.193) [Olavius algarvensis Delta 4 endosymbiont]
MRRFKIDPGRIKGNTCVITGPDAKHMINVLRLKADDRVVLFDGTGWEYAAVIQAISSGEVRLSVHNSRPGLAESPARITVAQGFLKDKKMDTLIRQLTELGISRWVPYFGVRSVARPDAQRLSKRTARWHKIATEALKQCRRSQLPEIEPAADFSAVLQLAASAAVKLIFWEAESAPLRSAELGGLPQGDVFIILGPEGGFVEAEIEQARRAGFQSVSLGPRILRAETATLAAGTLAQFLFGDLGDGQD